MQKVQSASSHTLPLSDLTKGCDESFSHAKTLVRYMPDKHFQSRDIALTRVSMVLIVLAPCTLAACTLAGCSTAPRRTTAERAADGDIASGVQAALLADPTIYARHIDIEVDRGVVHLGGFVWDNEDFTTARRDAASIPGATAVVNDMELVRGGISGTGR
jgi:BON domain